MTSALLLAFALGLRHGTDPDHLTAIDGLSRVRPHPANGLLFAVGHGLVVTLLAVGVGGMLSERLAWVGPWALIGVGAVNLYRILRPARPHAARRPIVAQPLLLGMLLAAGFETASQFAALVLTERLNAWVVGAAFTLGMVLVDGVDGYLAASTQSLAAAGGGRAVTASRAMGVVVVAFAFGIGGAELAGLDLDAFALPAGVALFVVVVAARVWARGHVRTGAASSALAVPVAA